MGIEKSRSATGTRTKRRLYCTTGCTGFSKCRAVWKSHQDHSTSDGHYAVNGQVAGFSCIPERCRHFLEVRRSTSGLPADYTQITVERQCACYRTEILLLRRPYWLFGSRNSSWLNWYIDKWNRHDSLTTTPHEWDFFNSFLDISNGCWRIVWNLADIPAPLNCKVVKNQPFLFGQLKRLKLRCFKH